MLIYVGHAKMSRDARCSWGYISLKTEHMSPVQSWPVLGKCNHRKPAPNSPGTRIRIRGFSSCVLQPGRERLPTSPAEFGHLRSRPGAALSSTIILKAGHKVGGEEYEVVGVVGYGLGSIVGAAVNNLKPTATARRFRPRLF